MADGDAQVRHLRSALAAQSDRLALSGKRSGSVVLLVRPSPIDRSQLEILFIKRANRPGDRFSGDVAFPGGRQDPGETDLETAVREMKEEIGIDLLDPPGAFQCCGQIHDRRAQDIVVHCFVFFQMLDRTPALSLQPAEVAACLWVPMGHFLRPLGEICSVQHWPRSRFDGPASKAMPMRLLSRLGIPWLLGVHQMRFTTLDLPVSEELLTLAEIQPSAPAAPADLRQTSSWRLWGLTLSMLGDFLQVTGRRENTLSMIPVATTLGFSYPRSFDSAFQSLYHIFVRQALKRSLGVELGLGHFSRIALYTELVALSGVGALLTTRVTMMVALRGSRRSD